MLVGEAVPNRCDEVGSDRTICWKVSNKNKWPNIFSQNIPKYPEQKRVFFFSRWGAGGGYLGFGNLNDPMGSMGQANHVLDKALLASGLEWWKSHDGDPDSPLWPG